MSGILAGATVIGGGLSYLGSRESGEAAATGARDAAVIQAEAAEKARADLAPFRAAGYDALGMYQSGINERPSSYAVLDPVQRTAAPTGFQGQGSRFTGTRFDEAIPASRFSGSRFSYDPRQAMQSPDIQFLQQQGEQALMRNLAGNRQLGSGSRMMDIMRFNQGLASQGLQDYYNRQLEMNRENYGRARDEEASAYNRSIGERDLRRQDEMEAYRRALGEEESAYQRGLTERGVGLEDWQLEGDRRIANQQAIQQAIIDRYNQGLRAYEDRMSRIGGLIDVGSGAGSTSAAIQSQAGANQAQIAQNLGNAQAAAALGQYSALGSTFGNLGNLAMLDRMGYFTNPYTQMQNTLTNQPTAGSGFYSANPYGQ